MASTDPLFRSSDEIIRTIRDRTDGAQLPPTPFVQSLTTKGQNQESLALRVELGEATIIAENSGRIDKSMTIGSIFLITDNARKSIRVGFGIKDGAWVEDTAVSFVDLYISTLHFAYAPLYLKSSAQRTLNRFSFD